MTTIQQASEMQGGFTPTTSFEPNRVLCSNSTGYAYATDITIEQLESFTQYVPPLFTSLSVSTSDFTNAYMNSLYPVGGFPIGSVVIYTNITDLPSNTAHLTRIGTATWDLSLTPIKLI